MRAVPPLLEAGRGHVNVSKRLDQSGNAGKVAMLPTRRIARNPLALKVDGAT